MGAVGGLLTGWVWGGPFRAGLGSIWGGFGSIWGGCGLCVPPGPLFGLWAHFWGPPPPKFRKPRRRVRRLRRRERLRADELLHSAPPLRHSDFGSRWGRPTP